MTNNSLSEKPEEKSISESIRELALVAKIFWGWVKKNIGLIAAGQVLCFLIGYSVYQSTDELVECKARICTNRMPAVQLAPFFEALRDAELKNQLDLFWKKGGYNQDGNDVENLRLWLPKDKTKYAVDSNHFLIQFQQNFTEPDSNTAARLGRIIAPCAKEIRQIKSLLEGNKLTAERSAKYSEFFKNYLTKNSSNMTISDFKFLHDLYKEFDSGKEKSARESELIFNVEKIEKQVFKPKKIAVFSFLGTEILMVLFFLLRFLFTESQLRIFK